MLLRHHEGTLDPDIETLNRRYVCYGATKRGQPQMTDSLVAELEKGVQGYDRKQYPGKVMVHTLSPGELQP